MGIDSDLFDVTVGPRIRDVRYTKKLKSGFIYRTTRTPDIKSVRCGVYDYQKYGVWGPTVRNIDYKEHKNSGNIIYLWVLRTDWEKLVSLSFFNNKPY